MWSEASAETAFEDLFGGNKGPYHPSSAAQLKVFYSRGFALPPEELFQNLCGMASGDPSALLRGLTDVPAQKSNGFPTPRPK